MLIYLLAIFATGLGSNEADLFAQLVIKFAVFCLFLRLGLFLEDVVSKEMSKNLNFLKM